MEYRILGPLEVLADGAVIPLGPKPRTLLAVLLLHPNEVVSAARLADELWGDPQPASAAKVVIVRLCTGLEPALYHYEADTHRLRRLGPPPEGFPGKAAHVALAVSLRHARIAWKYERGAYALALMNLGVLFQTLWLTATAMGLGGFPLATFDTARFALATGLDPLDEAGLGAFLLGRPRTDLRR